MSSNKSETTVDDYILSQPEKVQTVLQQLRQMIKSAAPMAEEVISYKIPTYKQQGALVHFAAFPKHCSFIVVSKNILDRFKTELQPYKTTGTTIHFTPDNPLPEKVVSQIVQLRLAENAENAKNKSPK